MAIPTVEEIPEMSHEELVKAWVEQEAQAQADIDKEADYEPVSEPGDYQGDYDRLSKMSPEELEAEFYRREEAANKGVKKSAEKVTAEDIAWLQKARAERLQKQHQQPQRVHFEKICPRFTGIK